MVLHNPNNWHWVDKNCIAWSRDYFGEDLPGTSAEKNGVTAEITKVKSVEGDVEVCQRKGKVISLFDVELDMAFKGKSNDEEVTGTIKVPEVSYDNDEDDFQFNISMDGADSDASTAVKTVVRQVLVPKLRTKLAGFGPSLIKTHGGGIQHNGNESIHWAANEKPGVTSKTILSNSGSKESSAKAAESAAPADDKKFFGVQAYNTTTVTVKPTFTASPEQLYAALTTPPMVAAWTRGAPNLEPKVGGTFSLFGGNISGKFQELDANKTMKMQWRLRDWKSGHFATLTHTFVVKDNETELRTTWVGIPVGEEQTVENNFQEYYVKPIKATFGYGIL